MNHTIYLDLNGSELPCVAEALIECFCEVGDQMAVPFLSDKFIGKQLEYIKSKFPGIDAPEHVRFTFHENVDFTTIENVFTWQSYSQEPTEMNWHIITDRAELIEYLELEQTTYRVRIIDKNQPDHQHKYEIRRVEHIMDDDEHSERSVVAISSLKTALATEQITKAKNILVNG